MNKTVQDNEGAVRWGS